jgi:RNA polymerase sigma-70 factor (ECF subfamily)
MRGEQGRDKLQDFQALVSSYREAVYRVAYRLTGNRDDAEDLLQESLIEAFQAFARFHPGTRFDRWVGRIMTRTYIDFFRRRKRVETLPFDETKGEGAATPAEGEFDPEEMLERMSRNEAVQRALDRLRPEFRAAVVLCDVQGFSYEEASWSLRCPVGTLRSRLHRGREQLRGLLRPLLEREKEG